MDSRRTPLPAGLVVLAFFALPSSAWAAGWLAPVTVQPSAAAPGGTSGAATASNALGAQALTWNDNITNGDGGAVCVNGEVVTRASGGTWTSPTVTGCNTVVAVGPNDEVVAVWTSNSGGPKLYAASGTAGQQLGARLQIASAAGNMWTPIVRFDPSGIPTVAWSLDNGVTGYDVLTTTRNASGTWPVTPTTAVATASNAIQPSPDLAFGPGGDGVLAYHRYMNSGGYAIVALYRSSASAGWVAASPLYGPTTTGSLTSPPRVRFDPQGRATVMEAIMTSSTPTLELDTWTRAAGVSGTWGATQSIPNASGGAFAQLPEGDLAFDASGNGLAAWMYGTTSPSTSMNVRVATRAPGASAWSTGLVTLASSNFGAMPSVPRVVFDSHDNATVGFSYSGGLHIFSRPAGSSTFAPQSLPPGISGSNPVIATDANGYMVATWTDANGITSTSVYDPVPPMIDTFDVPASGTGGTPVSFNVTGSDVWGPVTFALDFGDGQAAAGRALRPAPGISDARARAANTQTVQHTYSQPGTYTATLAMTDGASNTTTTTRSIAVAAPPVADPVLPPIPGLPDPVVGVSVNLAPVKPVVLVQQPGARKFVPLVAPAQVRIGSIIDARKGRVRITIANGRGGFDTADFYEGVFRILQLTKPGSVAALQLYGGSFKGCLRAPKPVLFSRKRLSPKRSVRHLWGAGTGSFRTVGRYSSATIRGTTWLTDDRCNGTRTRVTNGKVGVRDFVRRKTIVVNTRRSYFARPRAKRK